MKVCFYAHDWNYIDNYEPVIKILESQNIDFDVLALKKARHESYGYFAQKYKQKYSDKFITLYDIKFGKKISSLSKLPVLGPIAEANLNISLLKHFLAKKKYTHLVVSDDRIIEACVLIKAANEARVKNIVLYPVEGLQITEGLMLTKVQSENSLPESKRREIAAKMSVLAYPANTVCRENKLFYFYSPNEVLRLAHLEIFPKNPWARGSNRLTKIAVNSRMQAEENYRQGIKAEKIFITGFPPHDKLAEFIKNRRAGKQKIQFALGLNTSKKIILIAGTNYSDDFHPSRFNRLNMEISRVVSLLLYKMEGDYDLVFKIHPRVDASEQKNIFTPDVFKRIAFVKDEFSIYELATVSDCILNFVSASMDASLSTDAPIFSYKLPGREIFEEETKRYKSITPLNGIGELERSLSVLGKIPAFSEKLREEDRRNFGIFDGRNAERFVSMLLL